MKMIVGTLLLLLHTLYSLAQNDKLPDSEHIPKDFVSSYYQAYSGQPKAEHLSPFYAEDVILEDPTFKFVGKGKKAIFQPFDKANLPNDYRWEINQQITEGNRLVTEGTLHAKYYDLPYKMRFVNIFHFRKGKIFRQYDYYDNTDYYKVVQTWKSRQNK